MQKKVERINKKYNKSFLFVNTYEEFTRFLEEDVILYISIRKIYMNYKKLLKLILENPKRIFFIYRDSELNLPPIRIDKIFYEMNVVTRWDDDFYRIF